ncbi:uncharacterized protein LOC130613046 [Hydractinia symbiolongicarpus]|uniref:uncharacterized protein LOC130613046 n=1 Tax=Hydractinia symbiolongicarpus TaxID=13093 RepID=UPI00254CF71E|nr:uncharacterized protein LOC130613046 [Hydractinia symbiolongicarpus]
MSKALKPSRLDIDPTPPKAAKERKHWKGTFDLFTFITECGTEAPDKFRSVINFISSDVFEYVEECTTYDQVVETLTKLYVKTPNTIFARRQLSLRKQKPGEPLDEYLEELKKLSKHCNFEAVTAETYRSEMIRDSFINGLTSSYIRQRLLETTVETESDSESVTSSSLAALRKGFNPRQATRKKSCYFCGGAMHTNGSLCPARDATCHNCSKTGHFSSVCQSTKNKAKDSNLSAIYSPTLCAISAACPSNLRHASVQVTINGTSLDALIDSCSSDNFFSEKAFKSLNIPMTSSDKKVSMALTSMQSAVIGSCMLTLSLNDHVYENVKHKNVIFEFRGTQPDLVITGKQINDTNVAAITDEPTNVAKVKPPSLFKVYQKISNQLLQNQGFSTRMTETLLRTNLKCYLNLV